MIASVENMKETFLMCNAKYFEGKLPKPKFELMHSFKLCALFYYNSDWFGGRKFYGPIIRFTDYYEFTESVFVDLMCHEMIHYYLAYNGIDRKCRHGKEFMQMANGLNKKYKLHIRTEYDMLNLKRSKNAPLLGYWLSKWF